VHEYAPAGALSRLVDESRGPAGSLLAENGPFAKILPGFAPRHEQIELAVAIEAALDAGETLVAEAGTGIGKTLAYLVPVMLSGQRAIISTGTKNLQDQLYFRDLPLVAAALDSAANAALLKGRGNYLCLYRMDQTRESGELPSRKAVAELEQVFQWSKHTIDGDLSVSTVITDDSGLWPFVTSTADNCLGTECPRFDSCFVAQARKQAQDADIVVVNHHLLFADMAIKQSGFGEVLPGAGVFVIDEAHEAPEVASQFFSATVSARQITDLCQDILAESGKQSAGLATTRDAVEACRMALQHMQAMVSEHLPDRGTWQQLVERQELREALQALDQAVADLAPALDALDGSSRGVEACINRRAELQLMFDRLDLPLSAGEVRWFERRGRGFALHITPLDVSSVFTAFREQQEAAWILTSATLSVSEAFGHFTRQMGLDDARTLKLDSPFDYPNHALLWLPRELPDPRSPGFRESMLELMLPVLQAAGGRAFLLFTSHRALQEAAAWLEQRVDFPLFVQGEMPRSLLLEKFRESGNGILLGTASFWGGVDVIGQALTLVVIDKLPFAAPDDPVMMARSEEMRQAGDNPFMALYLPRAVIALKQGAGRLIRDVNDRGVLVICDSRIGTSSYGPAFLGSLPPMKRARDRAEVVEFLEHLGD
jgi:ATP-dependent DNA helicase DinG